MVTVLTIDQHFQREQLDIYINIHALFPLLNFDLLFIALGLKGALPE